MLKVQELPLSVYVNRLKGSDYFSFARYGDGEYNAIRKVKNRVNADKHMYFDALGEDLKRSLSKSMPYYYGIQRLMKTHEKFCKYITKVLPNTEFVNSDVFHEYSESGGLNPLITTLREKTICFIGNSDLRNINKKVFAYKYFIEIPKVNCYLQMNKVKNNIIEFFRYKNKDVVYAFSSGMMTEVLIFDLFDTIGKQNWLIDFGSLWDVYLGLNTRKYHNRMTPEIINKNLWDIKNDNK